MGSTRAGRRDPRPCPSAADDIANGCRRGEPAVWGLDSHKQATSSAGGGPTVLQPSGNGCSDLVRQWHRVAAVALSRYGNDTFCPVDIIQRQTDDFAGPQSHLRQ